MTRHPAYVLAAATALLLPLATAASPAGEPEATPAAAEATIPVPESIRVRNIPPLPASLADALRPYSQTRAASFQDWHPSERRMLVTTRFGEVSQVHEVARPGGARTQLTFFDEPAGGARYRPGRDQVSLSYNEGGAENYQLYLLDRDRGTLERFTDGVHRHLGGRWSHDGEWLAYASNARNGRDFDLYVANPGVAGSERRVAELEGQWAALDWSGDDRQLLMRQYLSINESYLWLVAADSGERRALTPPEEGRTVAYGDARFSPDGDAIYTTSDRDGEFMRLVRIGLDDGGRRVLTPDLDWDVEDLAVTDDGAQVAFTVNEDGIGRIHLLDTADGTVRPGPDLPPGVVSDLAFRPGSHELAFELSWARSTRDVWSWDTTTGELVQWTFSEAGGLPLASFPVPELVRYPTFDEAEPGVRRTIPAFVILPDPRRFPPPWPVYVDIHGGPEGQERPGFYGSTHYLLDGLGVAVVRPNVRGSAGYGKSYLLLDNGRLREDSVRDVGALLDWIAGDPRLDASRVMVGGGSYGGYMVLASLTLFGDRLRCGFDYVGISSFVTFLENTQDYRRDLRRAEYGDERDPEMRAHLESISPANRVDRLTRPLLVAQGANDPRVPLSESDQIVEKTLARGTPVWYLVAADEGHGFAKKTNADYLRAAWVRFVDRCLKGDAFAAPAVAGGR